MCENDGSLKRMLLSGGGQQRSTTLDPKPANPLNLAPVSPIPKCHLLGLRLCALVEEKGTIYWFRVYGATDGEPRRAAADVAGFRI